MPLKQTLPINPEKKGKECHNNHEILRDISIKTSHVICNQYHVLLKNNKDTAGIDAITISHISKLIS